MKKFINDPTKVVDEALEGYVDAYSDMVEVLPDARVLVRKNIPSFAKVGVITGGGSGHKPAFLGYVGEGLCDAAAIGEIFAAPPADWIYKGIKSIDMGKGVICLYGNFSGDIMNFRMARTLAEADGIEVDYLDITQDVDSDPSLGVPIITGYLSSNPDCDLIVTDHGGLTAQLENYITAAGFGPDDIIGAGFSLSPATAEGIENGYIDLVSEGQPFVQGFQAVLGICMAKKYGFTGLYIDTGGGFAHKGNIEYIAPLAEEGIR